MNHLHNRQIKDHWLPLNSLGVSFYYTGAFFVYRHYVDFLKSGKTGDGAVALPQVLDSHGLANDKKCRWYFHEKEKRMALSTRLRSNNSLVRSNVPRGEIKTQTYEKWRERHKSKAPWAAHGWIAQSQVYFYPCGKTSLCAKLLVWKYMSPVYLFAFSTSTLSEKEPNGNSEVEVKSSYVPSGSLGQRLVHFL